MRPLLLCRERLHRLLSVLDREGGTCSLRDLFRTYRIHAWEVEQAEVAGWVAISERKPVVGRPSRVAAKLSKSEAAKLPPWRFQIPKELSVRHWRFAFETTCSVSSHSYFGLSLSSATRAYLIAFPQARSRAGAAASASRLLKKPMIRAARRWFQSCDSRTIHEEMPKTPEAIYARIRERDAEQAGRRIW